MCDACSHCSPDTERLTTNLAPFVSLSLQNSYREEMGSAEAAAGDLRAREREIEAVRKDLEMQAAVHNEQLQKAEEQLRRLQEQAARELPAEVCPSLSVKRPHSSF